MRNHRLLFGAPLVLWTAYWAVVSVGDVLTQSALGRGEVSGAPAAHQVFEVVFVAGQGGLRWLIGAGLLLAAWASVRHRRLTARRVR